MTAALHLLVDVLATYRLTRLVVEDTLTEPTRRWLVLNAYAAADRPLPNLDHLAGGPSPTAADVVAADIEPPKVAYLLTCPWCSGVYVAAGVSLARALLPRPWSHVARALALSASAGILARGD